MRKTVFFLNCILSLLLLSVAAVAYPEVGHQFYGYAGSGSTVTVTYEELTFTTSVDSDGYYGYDTLFFVDAASDDIEGAEEGDTLTFSLDATEITTYTFSIGGITKLDFEDDPATSSVETAESSSDSDSSSTDSSSDDDDSDSDDDDDDSDSDDDDSNGGGRKSSSSSTDDEAEDCSHKWTCKSWGACEKNGFQTRTCYYVGDCAQEGNQSDTRQRCTYVAPEEEPVIEEEEPTCYDGVQNQGERGKDCGGPCDACPTAPVVEEPKTNWLYIGLAIFLLLLIIAIILAHKYKDKLLPYWEKFKGKWGIKQKAAPAVAQTMQRPAQYPQYQQQYRPQYPQVRK
ncbi:hypothetical protein HZC31_03490 [Candidatus Woesearchaeota archaeon]|nr:hypothetical protein [Candidatus Woesearchaeota archaeon]